VIKIIKLYGLSTCSRCTISKMMLEKRNIKFEYIIATEDDYDLPILKTNEGTFRGKEAMLEIRKMKPCKN